MREEQLMKRMVYLAVISAFAVLASACSAVPESGGTGGFDNIGGASGGSTSSGDGGNTELAADSELIEFNFHPGYGDMSGEYHNEYLHKNDAGEWTIECRDSRSFAEPTVVTEYAVSADAVKAFEGFIRNNDVASLADRPDSDLFVTDYSPWSYEIRFSDPAGKDPGGIRFSMEEYREYSDRDRELLIKLREQYDSLKGEIVSQTAEAEDERYDSGDIYCVLIPCSGDENEKHEIEMKLDEAGYYFVPPVDPDDYTDFDDKSRNDVTTVVSIDEEEINRELEIIKKAGFPDAYVGNIGQYTGDKLWVQPVCDGDEEVEVLRDCVILHDAHVYVPYNFYVEPVLMDVIVDRDTVFDRTEAKDRTDNYDESMSAYDWMSGNSDYSGFMEVHLEDGHVDTIYGAFYWDV